MARLDFGDTPVEQLATLMLVVGSLHADFYGNGQPGLKSKAEDFISTMEGIAEERERQHRQNSTKLNLIIIFLAAIAAYIALFLHH